jgi:hypothetical protein
MLCGVSILIPAIIFTVLLVTAHKKVESETINA